MIQFITNAWRKRVGLSRIATSMLMCATIATPLAAEQWNLPTGFAETNLHTVNAREFAADVEELTGGAVGYSGPVGLEGAKIYADESVRCKQVRSR